MEPSDIAQKKAYLLPNGRKLMLKEWPDAGCGTGTRIWDCGIILARYFEQSKKEQFREKSFIELGAGTGIVGLSIATQGASQVCLTDTSEVLPFTKRNAEENRARLDMSSLILEEVDWQATDIEDVIENLVQKVQRCDYIVASDVIFNEGQLFNVAKILKMLCAKFTPSYPEIYMSYKNRHEEISNKLAEVFEDAGFFGEQIEEEEMHPDFIHPLIDIFKFSYEPSH